MSVVTVEADKFQELIEQLLNSIQGQYSNDIWIDEREAMKLLGIKSKPTLQKYRDKNWIRFAQHGLSNRKCFIKYDKHSILEFLDRMSNK